MSLSLSPGGKISQSINKVSKYSSFVESIENISLTHKFSCNKFKLNNKSSKKLILFLSKYSKTFILNI